MVKFNNWVIVVILTIGTLGLWLSFLVASDFDRGRKLSKRLVFLEGVASPSFMGSGTITVEIRFETDPMVDVLGLMDGFGLGAEKEKMVVCSIFFFKLVNAVMI